MQVALAARYARALADVVREKSGLESAAADLDSIASLFKDSKPLRDFLLNPALPLDRKKAAMDAIARRGKLAETTARLIEILLRNGRIDLLPAVSEEFRKLEEEASNRLSAEVITAVPLEPAEQKKMTASLEALTGKKIRLKEKVDPAVLGGVRARIGSVIYDGTVVTRLAKLKRQLIGER